jgi:transposase
MRLRTKAIKSSSSCFKAQQEPPSSCHHSHQTSPELENSSSQNIKIEAQPLTDPIKNNSSSLKQDIPSLDCIFQDLEAFVSRKKLESGSGNSPQSWSDELNSLILPVKILVSNFMDKIRSQTLTIQELKAKVGQNSGNSSRPPSKDFGKPLKDIIKKALGDDTKRPQGGQPGHKRHIRPPLTREEADGTKIHDIPANERFCPHCGGALQRAEDKDFDYETLEVPPDIRLLRFFNISHGYYCPACRTTHRKLPKGVAEVGLISNSVASLMVDFNISHHRSVKETKKYLHDVFKVDISTGTIEKTLRSVALILRPIYFELQDNVKERPVVNADETPHNCNGISSYTWTFVTDSSTVFKIGTRSYSVLESVMGDNYRGIVGSDCYGCYIKLKKDTKNSKAQLCLAHVQREFAYCMTTFSPKAIEYGFRNVKLVKELIHLKNLRKQIEDRSSSEWKKLTDELNKIGEKFIASAIDAPIDCKKATTLSKRFLEYGDLYTTFINYPDIEPTNNAALSESFFYPNVL